MTYCLIWYGFVILEYCFFDSLNLTRMCGLTSSLLGCSDFVVPNWLEWLSSLVSFSHLWKLSSPDRDLFFLPRSDGLLLGGLPVWEVCGIEVIFSPSCSPFRRRKAADDKTEEVVNDLVGPAIGSRWWSGRLSCSPDRVDDEGDVVNPLSCK